MQAIDPTTLPPTTFLALAIAGLIGILLLAAGLILDIYFIIKIIRRRPFAILLHNRIRSRPWTWRDIITIVFILTGLHALAFACLQWIRLFNPGDYTESFKMALMLQTIFFHGAGLVIIMGMMRIGRISWRRGFGVDIRTIIGDVGRGAVLYIASIPVIACSAWIYRIILYALDIEFGMQDVVQIFISEESSWSIQVYIALLAIVAAPVVEEMLFRGIALPVACKHMRIVPAITVVSILFAAMHFHIPSFLPLIAVAACTATAYLYTGSIIVPMTMHAIFNGINMLTILLIKDIPTIQSVISSF